MFDSAALDVAVGLILMYLVLSLMCSALNELLEGWLKHRAVDLERGIRELLFDPAGTTFAKQFYDHPLVSPLFEGKYDPATTTTNLPSYIPSRTFALALLDIVAPATAASPSGATGTAAATSIDAPAAVKAIRDAVSAIQANDGLKRALLTVIDSSGSSVVQVRANVEQWFNSGMDRVSGWYRGRKQKIILAIGLAVAIAMNVSTMTVAKTLWTNKILRESLTAAADQYLETQRQDATNETAKQRLDRHVRELQSFGLAIGWTSEPNDPRSIRQSDPGIWLERLLGWLLTGCAISIGAPFWFDLLNKVSVVRSTVNPHEKSGEEPSKD